jgi:hypothetical protein
MKDGFICNSGGTERLVVLNHFEVAALVNAEAADFRGGLDPRVARRGAPSD